MICIRKFGSSSGPCRIVQVPDTGSLSCIDSNEGRYHSSILQTGRLTTRFVKVMLFSSEPMFGPQARQRPCLPRNQTIYIALRFNVHRVVCTCMVSDFPCGWYLLSGSFFFYLKYKALFDRKFDFRLRVF